MQSSLFKTMKYLLSRLAMFFLFMCISLMSYAQLALPRPLDGGPGTGGLEGPPEVPVDGGLTTVLAVGVGYGVKKLKERRKKLGTTSL